jgi:segregation and condensation protein B
MSLKAKLEAVVYAAEEPVTLAQLAVIFADEVLPVLDEAAALEAEAEPTQEEAVVQESLLPELAAPAAEAAAPSEDDEKKSARLRDRRVRQHLQRVLDELIADYANSERGMEIREIAGGYRMATKPE